MSQPLRYQESDTTLCNVDNIMLKLKQYAKICGNLYKKEKSTVKGSFECF